MRVLFIGPPGSGKGTQGRRIADRFHVVYLSSGEMLRAEVAAGTTLGRKVALDLANGDLVPDDVMLELLRDPLERALASGGYVLDGFPRNVTQAGQLDAWAAEIGASPQAACWFDVEEEELLRRTRSRARIEGRGDDKEPVTRHRIEVYLQETAPLVAYYRDAGIVIRVDAARDVDAVTAQLLAELDGLAPRS